MRDYKYIWRKSLHEVVISGLQFQEYRNLFSDQTLLLLRHKCDSSNYDPVTRFEYVRGDEITETSKEIYSWGDFSFIVFANGKPNELTKDEIKSFLYFAHMGTFDNDLQDNRIKGGCYIHDDGWFLSYSGNNEIINELIKIALAPNHGLIQINDGQAIIIYNGIAHAAPATYDIDMILNGTLRIIKSAQQVDTSEPASPAR